VDDRVDIPLIKGLAFGEAASRSLTEIIASLFESLHGAKFLVAVLKLKIVVVLLLRALPTGRTVLTRTKYLFV
jgi:hypothetical protein